MACTSAPAAADVIDLHGRLDRVICLDCGTRSATGREFQHRMIATEPAAGSRMQPTMAPDGDADLDGLDFSAFRLPACEVCGGVLKPDVVYYGESVPRERVATAMDAVRASDALLVVGSSLMVFSGFRFARRAQRTGPADCVGQSRQEPRGRLPGPDRARSRRTQALAFLLPGETDRSDPGASG